MKKICHKLDVDFSDYSEYTADRLGNDMMYKMSPLTMKTSLSWKAKTDFEDGLNDTVDWYLENREWMESFKDK